jgi:hypothetical protein
VAPSGSPQETPKCLTFLCTGKSTGGDLRNNAIADDYYWQTANRTFFEEVIPNDSLWVVASAGKNHPGEWRLLQRIVARDKVVNKGKRRPYEIIGNRQSSQEFDIEAQPDLSTLLHKLEFRTGRKIIARGTAIGNTLQAIRPLTPSDAVLLASYSGDFNRSKAGRAVSEWIERAIKTGAGFGNPETNRKVERAAISCVTEWYESRGWQVQSVEIEKRGFDLLCVKRSIEEHVEVKGIQGSLPAFIITAREVRQAGSGLNLCCWIK